MPNEKSTNENLRNILNKMADSIEDEKDADDYSKAVEEGAIKGLQEIED